jgi:hypothetical protein
MTFKFSQNLNGFPPAISRQEVPKYFGGAVSAKTLANYDSAGKGPAGAFKVGRTVMYPTFAIAEWLDKRATQIGE